MKIQVNCYSVVDAIYSLGNTLYRRSQDSSNTTQVPLGRNTSNLLDSMMTSKQVLHSQEDSVSRRFLSSVTKFVIRFGLWYG